MWWKGGKKTMVAGGLDKNKSTIEKIHIQGVPYVRKEITRNDEVHNTKSVKITRIDK